MTADWKNEFAPHILARGKKYFEEGRVFDISQYDNTITAFVDGTEEYFVEINMPNGIPSRWQCTCPYADQGNCKHKAALLFAIEAGEYTFTTEEDDNCEYAHIPISADDIRWICAVEELPEEAIRSELLYLGKQYQLAQDRLVIRYLGHITDYMLAYWKSRIWEYSKKTHIGRQIHFCKLSAGLHRNVEGLCR